MLRLARAAALRAVEFAPALAGARAAFRMVLLLDYAPRPIDEAVKSSMLAGQSVWLSSAVAHRHAVVLAPAVCHGKALEAVDRNRPMPLACYASLLRWGPTEAVVAGHAARWLTCAPHFMGYMASAYLACGVTCRLPCSMANRWSEQLRTMFRLLSWPGWWLRWVNNKDAIQEADRALRERDHASVVGLRDLPRLEPLRRLLRDDGRCDEFLTRLGLTPLKFVSYVLVRGEHRRRHSPHVQPRHSHILSVLSAERTAEVRGARRSISPSA